MRAFSLVSVLVVVAIMFYLFTMNTAPVAKTNAVIKPQVQQLAGQNEDGTKAGDSVKYTPIERNGVIKSMKVASIKPGALVKYWGLKVNDEIVEIGETRFGQSTLESEQDCKDWVVEGMQRQMKMKVNRSGNPITLPDDRNAL